jgi:hypothetical protein
LHLALCSRIARAGGEARLSLLGRPVSLLHLPASLLCFVMRYRKVKGGLRLLLCTTLDHRAGLGHIAAKAASAKRRLRRRGEREEREVGSVQRWVVMWFGLGIDLQNSSLSFVSHYALYSTRRSAKDPSYWVARARRFSLSLNSLLLSSTSLSTLRLTSLATLPQHPHSLLPAPSPPALSSPTSPPHFRPPYDEAQRALPPRPSPPRQGPNRGHRGYY